MSRAWPYAKVIAHRGGGSLAPENTIAAIKVGIEHGYRAVEFDAMLAADDVPVLMHDATLERTASIRAAVSERTAAELGRIDVGAWHSARFAGETVPALHETLGFCRANNVWVNIEIKPAPGFEAATGLAVARVAAHVYADAIRNGGAAADNVDPRVPLLSSFSTASLVAARDAAPHLPRGWLVEKIPEYWREQLAELSCVSLHASQRHLTALQAAMVKRWGAWLFCYTVNSVERARELLGWGVDAFCTDAIDKIAPDLATS